MALSRTTDIVNFANENSKHKRDLSDEIAFDFKAHSIDSISHIKVYNNKNETPNLKD